MLERKIEALRAEIRALQARVEYLQQVVYIDELTGLYNHQGLMEVGRHEIERARRYGRMLALILFDVDNLRHINDLFGHAMGDELLLALSEHCDRYLRAADVLAHLDSGQFAVVLPETTHDGGQNVARRLCHRINEATFVVDSERLAVTISLGVAYYDGAVTPDGTFPLLFNEATKALALAKQAGRGQLYVVAGDCDVGRE